MDISKLSPLNAPLDMQPASPQSLDQSVADRISSLSQGASRDTFTFSEEGLKLSQDLTAVASQKLESIETPQFKIEQEMTKQTEKKEEETESKSSYIDKMIKQKQMEIKAVQESNMPEEEKREKLSELNAQLVQLLQEKLKAEDKSPHRMPGGTRAQGFSSSLT